MKIHHLNCGSLNARFPRAQAIIYCLLVETNDGLVLVDTGFGRQDYSEPSRLMKLFTYWMGVPRKMEETSAYQIVELGYTLEDVQHIVLTHLHLDHAGGLRDFPKAQVHVYLPEYEAAMNPRGLIERAYDPAHWSHGPKWVFHQTVAPGWFGFEYLRIIEGLIPEIMLIPLPGHTRGHCGVAIATSNGWLLHCGDAASPLHRDTDLHGLEGTKHTADILPGWFARQMIGPHVPRLRKLIQEHGDEVEVISSHDSYSFAKAQEGEAILRTR